MSIHFMHAPSVRLTACVLLAAGTVLNARADYLSQSLRGNLSPLPYYDTAGGRDGKRFTDAPINRYRIYDFYARQAEYYLSNPSDKPDILPPFPELDGGRRGHWGGTNDKESGAYDRPQAPDFTTVTARAARGLFYVLAGPPDDPAVIVFNGITDSFDGFFPRARMSVPQHFLGLSVDRFGFGLDVHGKVDFGNSGGDWLRDGKKAGRFTGYYVQGSSAVFRSEVEGAQLLERPSVALSRDGAHRFLSRDFEFVSGTRESLEFRLPRTADVPGGAGMKWSTEAGKTKGEQLMRGQAGDIVCLHRVITGGGLAMKPRNEGGSFDVTPGTSKGRFLVMSWCGPEKESAAARAALAAVSMPDPKLAPSSCLNGGPSRFPKTTTVAGRLDADSASRSGPYVIDDIPVPVSDNPYRTPMTLCGLAFASDGTAYASTLVGDVWKITGLQGDLRKVVWKRYASGLDLPLGVEVVDGVPYVNARRFILRLVDLNNDGEADLYERFSREDLPNRDENGRDLRRDAGGNFYYNAGGGIFRLPADGSGLTRIGEGSRNPFGLAVRKDGLVLSDSSEGDNYNGTCTIFESDHPENKTTRAKRRRILYLPRGIDNSPGSRLFMDEPRFGPLGSSLLGVSFGTGTWYYMIRDTAEGTPQAALVPMPGNFSSGSGRLAVQPRDGQLFVAGLDGWGDQATTEGCLHRVRWSGRDATVLTGWKACRNGILLTFNRPPASQLPAPDQWFVQEWNYIDTRHTYGSPEYSVKSPDKIGHDRLRVRSARSVGDASVFLEIPDLLPAMCLHVHAKLVDAQGQPQPLDAYFTLNHLMADHPAAPPAPKGKAVTLVVPERDSNGDTYQNVVTYFDKLYGRATADRPESAPLNYRKEDLSYAWLKKNLIDAQCMPCHGSGTQHDFTTYDGLMRKVDLKNPERSALLGLMRTKSMPPYPLPSVPAATSDAVLEWIKRGAPR